MAQKFSATIDEEEIGFEETINSATPIPQINQTWEHPANGWVKLNVDGAYWTASNKSTVAWVARDNTGHIVARFQC